VEEVVEVAVRIPAAVALAAGALLGVPGALGVVVGGQVREARRRGPVARPDYAVDLRVDPPWVDGSVVRVAFLGDSLVEGVGAPTAEQSLPAQTAYRLAAHLGRPVHVRGLGITSSRVEDVVREQVPRLDADVDLVLVVVGANDVTSGTPPWLFARQLEQLVAAAQARTGGAPVVFTGLPELEHAPLLLARPLRDVAAALGDTLHRVQRRTAERLPGARYIDVRREVAEGLRRRRDELFAADGYHPNPAGYALLGEGIARSLADLLRAEGEALAAEAVAHESPVRGGADRIGSAAA
jgi:lysophospholipase L1-like esterase